MTLTTRLVQSVGWLILAPVLVVAALILAGTWVAGKAGSMKWLVLLVADVLHPLFYQPWTPDAVQSWWYEHVCRPLGEMQA